MKAESSEDYSPLHLPSDVYFWRRPRCCFFPSKVVYPRSDQWLPYLLLPAANHDFSALEGVSLQGMVWCGGFSAKKNRQVVTNTR